MTMSPHFSDDGLPLQGRGLGTLAPDYDLILCDVWGVVHNGVARHAPAVEALQRFRRGGGTVVLVTNAPAPARNVIRRLASLGVPPDAYDAIATSGDVTAQHIAEAHCPPVYNIGPDGEFDIYAEAARLGPHAPALVSLDRADLVVVIGPSQAPGAKLEDYDPGLAAMKARNLLMICANPDIVVEVGDRLEYCAGAVAERYERIGGRVLQAGKPFPAIYERALGLARDKAGAVPHAKILAIGDAMHTDMAGAHRLGVDALFITAGIHRAELHGAGPGRALDQAAFRQFLSTRALRPKAAMPVLTW